MQNLFVDGYQALKQQIENGKEEIPFLKTYVKEIDSAEYDENGLSLEDGFTKEENEADKAKTLKKISAIEKMIEAMEELKAVYK